MFLSLHSTKWLCFADNWPKNRLENMSQDTIVEVFDFCILALYYK